jgi:hypothetical protein
MFVKIPTIAMTSVELKIIPFTVNGKLAFD